MAELVIRMQKIQIKLRVFKSGKIRVLNQAVYSNYVRATRKMDILTPCRERKISKYTSVKSGGYGSGSVPGLPVKG